MICEKLERRQDRTFAGELYGRSVVRGHRYFGPNRNAGYGHTLIWRCRRALARRLLWLPQLGYLVDVDRNRHRED